MEYNQFRQLLQLKGIREKDTVPLLRDFTGKFPYCQTSQLLLAKALHDQGNIHYHQQLKMAAAYAANREVLRDLIEMKTEEVEFVFPPPKKEETGDANKRVEVIEDQIRETAGNIPAPAIAPQSGKDFEEWYSEDEISGRAFEEQKEKEKLVDPHEVIRKRLSEILSGNTVPGENAVGPPSAGPLRPSPQETADGMVDKTPPAKASPEEKTILPVEIKENVAPRGKADVEEDIFKEEILEEKKIEEELLHPSVQKSAEEKAIIAQAEKARDVLDKMEVEHAMEESILESIEKLPPIVSAPVPVQKTPVVTPGEKTVAVIADKVTPRSFTDWLKTIHQGKQGGFEEVHAPQPAGDPVPGQSEIPDDQLSDDELIEKFLLEDPRIVPSRTEFYSPISQAKKSVMDHDDVVSETLAQIYLRQGNTQKARWCYEKLILLHPEKSAFFAALLKEIPEGGN